MMTVRDVVVENAQAADANLRQRHWAERLAFGGLWLTGGVVIVVLFFVIGYLLFQSVQFFIGPENVLESVALADSNEAVRAQVTATPGAIGYLSLAYLDGTTRALALNGVAPTVANVTNGTYPLRRTLYLVTLGEPTPAAQAWLDFVRSAEGQRLVAEAGYVALSDAPNYQPPTTG
jgi:hypothetical protein